MKEIVWKHKKFFIISIAIIFFLCRNVIIHTFSTEKWVKYPQKRVDIVDNLLEKHELLGMPVDEVFLLLGEDTPTLYFKTETNMVYFLGPERGLIRIDSEWLVLEIQDNRISQVDICRD